MQPNSYTPAAALHLPLVASREKKKKTPPNKKYAYISTQPQEFHSNATAMEQMPGTSQGDHMYRQEREFLKQCFSEGEATAPTTAPKHHIQF
mmetsp:Transcript_16031/g.32921  ORF Transcript_16031/g.32921 Transcript_16031/m.32921 type:complete len:92 (+) Transcript_16031:149-424(+)